MGSSAIEGLRVGPRRVLAAEERIARGAAVTDGVAAEVVGNIDAMRRAVAVAAQPGPLTLGALLEVHRLLMDRSPTPELGGVLREEQGWIGGRSFNPTNAVYVPPPPDRVAGLMDDLVAYVNTTHHSPLTQAAVAHAQFETIHPFGDGNGRAGRALIHIVLQRRGLAPRVVPPISLVLATWSDSYVGGLTEFRHEGAADSPQRDRALEPWLDVFAAATWRACAEAAEYSDRISELTDGWKHKLGRYRKGSALERLLERLPGAPLLTPDKAAQLIGRSPVATRAAITQLVDAGILRLRPTSSPRNRVLEAPAVIHMLTTLERSLATPQRNTRQQRPVRPVPDKPQPPNTPTPTFDTTTGRPAPISVQVRPHPLDNRGWEVATTDPTGNTRQLSGPHPTAQEAEAARDFIVRLLNTHPQLRIPRPHPQPQSDSTHPDPASPKGDRPPTVGIYTPHPQGPWHIQSRNPDGTENATSPPYPTYHTATHTLDQIRQLSAATTHHNIGHRAVIAPTTTTCRCSQAGWRCEHTELDAPEIEPPNRGRGLSL